MKMLMAVLAGLLLGLVSSLSPALAQDYQVKPGDVLKIEVLEDPTLNRSVLVAPDGRISMPLAGNLKVSGQSVDSVASGLASKMAGNFAAAPTVSVSLERLADRVASGGGVAAAAATIDVYVLGEAAKSGRLQLAPGTTVLQAFAEMGGFSKFAATKRIQLRRGGVTYTLNYKMIEAGTSTDGNTTLKDGDVLVVPQRKLFE